MDQKVLKVLQGVQVEGLSVNPEPGRFVLSRSDSFWNISESTARFLQIMIKAIGAQRVLEIGTSNGYSGIHLAEALVSQQGVLYTIESHRERFELARKNFESAGVNSHIQQIFGHAPEIFTTLSGEFDLVFFDATKMEYKSYFDAILPQVRKGGLLIADNACSHGKEMKNYLDAVTHDPRLESVLLPFDSGLMLSYKV